MIEGDGVLTKVLFIFVEKFKTDQERRGHTIVLGADKAHPWKCPILFFKAHMKVRHSSVREGAPNTVLKQPVRAECLLVLFTWPQRRCNGGRFQRHSLCNEIWRSLAVYIYIHDDMSDSCLKVEKEKESATLLFFKHRVLFWGDEKIKEELKPAMILCCIVLFLV